MSSTKGKGDREKLSGMSRLVSKLASSAGRSPAPAAAPPASPQPKPVVAPFGRDARLSRYISTRAFNRPEGLGVQEVLRALGEGVRSSDKNARQQLVALLLRLFFFEELPPEAMQLVMPLFQAQGKDVRALRSLFYIAQAYVSCGAAGTPTLYDPALAAKRPEEKTLQGVLGEALRLLETPGLDPALSRSAFFLAAAAARSSPGARKQLGAAVQGAIAAADAAAAAGGPLGKAPRRSAATDWDLQHTAFAASRLGGSATGADDISRSFAVGIGSADPVGARHALGLGVDVAQRDAGFVVREAYEAVAEAAQQYEAAGPGPLRTPGQGVNLEDAFARLHLARLCAAVVHSDQTAADVSRDGAPFWRMLCLLATRDPVDMVRFGAIDALTGASPAAAAALGAAKPGGGREDAVQRQRRGRAWRLLVAQSASQVSVPGATDKGAMKLVDVLGRLLLLALRKAGGAGGSPARFCVAAGAVASLAQSCLASQTAGSARHGSSPDLDRVLGVLSAELAGQVEASLPAAERCAVIEALLYLQAAGYATSFTPAKLVQAGSGGGAAWSGGMQDSLLSAVLRCARAKPRQAATFLGYATAVVGIAPSGIDLAKITDLWDAAVAAGKEGRQAVLSAATEALASPPPPSALARGGGATPAEVARAAREEDGWNLFVSTAAWWLGENANALCEEFCGRRLNPETVPAGIAAALAAGSPGDAAGSSDAAASEDGEQGGGSEASDDAGEDSAAAAQAAAAAAAAAELLAQFGARSPALSRIILALQELMLTAVWQLRLAAAQALAKIAVRSGEPFRLQCYSVLAAAGGAGGGGDDALGLRSATRPALALLDKLYASQVVLDQLWAQHGEEVEAWPKDVVASLGRRYAQLAKQAERHVCSVPRERYSLLGHRAARVLAADAETGDSFASFLKSGSEPEQAAAATDVVGSELAASKNREVDAILGSAASDDAGSLTLRVASASLLSEVSAAGLDDRNKEIDRLLSGGRSGYGGGADPWAFGGGSTFNAFATDPAAPSLDASFPAAAEPSAGSTPRVAGASPRSASPEPGAWFGEPAGPAAKVVGTGTVLHTFVGDYAQPEELSVFEGDQVEVLEEADGWMLVRDGGGREGLVPTSYLQLDELYQQKLQSQAEAEAAAAAAEYQRKAAGTPTRAHRRGASVDWGQQQSKEDLLDNIFSSYGGNPQPMPSMPEEQPASFAEPSSFLAGSGGDVGGAFGGSLPPVAEQAPVWASQPSELYGEGPGGTSPRSRQLPGVSPGGHRRNPSAASSHRRTLSGTSSAGAAAAFADAYDAGSMPTTPSRVEGPERAIVAGFVGEMEGELSVEPGERVKVHSEVDGWARVIRISDRRSGLVPSWAVGGE